MRAFNLKAAIVIICVLSAAIAAMHSVVYFSINAASLSAEMPIKGGG
jgi:hypothetical protein